MLVLARCERLDGVLNRETADEERRTAHDAEDGHGKALLIAEEVARGHFVEEPEAPPKRADMLEENARSRSRRARAHERRGRFGEVLAAGDERRPRDACHERHDAKDGVEQVEVQAEEGQQVHGLEDIEQHVGDDHKPSDIADDAADERRGTRIDEVLGEDARVRVAERLVEANEPALLFYHARRRGETHKNGYNEEDDRDDAGDGLDG